jgi:hypothetical protein
MRNQASIDVEEEKCMSTKRKNATSKKGKKSAREGKITPLARSTEIRF